MTTLLPRDCVIVLKDVVVEDVLAIAGAVDAVAGIVVAEAREDRVAYALQAELAGPVTTISALSRGFEAMAASKASVEVVEHGGRNEKVIAQTHIFVALDVATGVKRAQ